MVHSAMHKFYRAVSILLVSLSLSPIAVAKETAPDFSQLLNFAYLASAAYANGAAIEQRVTKQGLVLKKNIHVPGYAVTGYLAVNDVAKTQYIVVRGTANAENAYVDMAVQLMPDKKAGVKIHQGFSQSASNFYQAVLPLLRKDYRVITIGHSLGGAVANILGMYLDQDGFDVAEVVTFGQPKVTNVSGAHKYEHLNVIRVVTPKDVVPLVPPLDPMDLMKLDIYWHMGEEVVLLDKNEYAILTGSSSMMRAGNFLNVVPDESNLQHHMLTEYIQRLETKLQNPKRVSYATGFNIFGSK